MINGKRIIVMLVVLFGGLVLTGCATMERPYSTVGFPPKLRIAINRGDVDKVKSLLEENPEMINAKDINGDTPLHCACKCKKKKVIDALIAKGANVNAKNNNGNTPMHLAARDNKSVVELLIANGADPDVNSKGEYGETLLHQTAYAWKHNSDYKNVKIINENCLELAMFLIDKGADVNAQIESGLNEGYTPLHIAATAQKDLAELLIAHGAKVDVESKDGYTPLCFAVIYGHLATVELLIEKGADVNTTRNKGMTPLHDAVGFGWKNIAELLIKNGANVNAKADGWTPLDAAATLGFYQIGLLIESHGGISEWKVPWRNPNVVNAIDTIALAPNGGVLADAIRVELINRGFKVIDTNIVADVMAQYNLNKIQIEETSNLLLLKEKGIDALVSVSVKFVTVPEGLLQKANVKMKITHIKNYHYYSFSSLLGKTGIPPDEAAISEAAISIVDQLADKILTEPLL